MANKYAFSIENNEVYWKWCKNNLDDRDYEVIGDLIRITYYNIMQKNDILKALGL
jgi:hypothetical protein